MTEGRERGREEEREGRREGGSLKRSSIFLLCRYNELTQVDPSEALRYLKTKLAECVNHNNPEHSQEVAMIAMYRTHTHTAACTRNKKAYLVYINFPFFVVSFIDESTF